MSLPSLIAETSSAQPNPVKLGSFEPLGAFGAGSDTQKGAIDNLESFVSAILGILTFLAAVFFVVQFVIGGFMWVSSGGDKGKLEQARNRMVYGVIGMIIIVASYSIIGLLGSLLGIDLLRPGAQLGTILGLQGGQANPPGTP